MCNVPLVSIILPVYNSARTVQTCIDSILTQSWEQIELIIIDDGSTDDSYSICQAYASNDDRIILLHQANFGPSSARNVGLDIAKGEYVYFVDSDDILENNLVEIMVSALENSHCQLGFLNFRVFGSAHIPKNKLFKRDNILSTEQALKFVLPDLLPSFTWIFFSQRTLYEFPYKIRFVDRRLREDQALLYILVSRAKKIFIESRVLYTYTIRNNSLLQTNMNSWDMACSMVQLSQERYAYFKDSIYFHTTLKANLSLLLDAYFIFYQNSSAQPDAEYAMAKCLGLITECISTVGIFAISVSDKFKYFCIKFHLMRLLSFLKKIKERH